jgi:hypothetical protein
LKNWAIAKPRPTSRHRNARLLGLGAFDLRTLARDAGHDQDRSGFTGTVTLRLARTAPPAARQILGKLARFAEFCGTGAPDDPRLRRDNAVRE